MGQYHYVVNLDKHEFIHPHRLGTGLKLWEQLANYPGTGAALIVLTAALREHRGGGDFDLDQNWHGPERTFPEYNIKPAPMPEHYEDIARQTIGRWAGDRIAIVGDYADDGDLPVEYHASSIYFRCIESDSKPKEVTEVMNQYPGLPLYVDISDFVCAVIEHELCGKYEGEGWRHFKSIEEAENA